MDDLDRLTRLDEWEFGARYRLESNPCEECAKRHPAKPPEVTFLGWSNGRPGVARFRHESGGAVARGTIIVAPSHMWKGKWLKIAGADGGSPPSPTPA